MPTFTSTALDRLLKQGASKSAADSSLDRRNSTPVRDNVTAVEYSSRHAKLKPSPALYATSVWTPLPDSSTPSSPSPYIVNHKRRGRRLRKSSSEANVVKEETPDDEVLCSSNLSDFEVETRSSSVLAGSSSVENGQMNAFHENNIGDAVSVGVNDDLEDLFEPNYTEKGSENVYFYDPQESMSVTSNTEGEDVPADQSARTVAPTFVFFDAWEELSSDCEHQPQSSVPDIVAEVREMRSSLLTEIEKRRQAEDALNTMQHQWQILREKLREVGLVLPTDLFATAQGAQTNVGSADDICQQIYTSRLVSESIGRGAARAECEEEMEAWLEVKNFEIARLSDRLSYYETMNHEMSLRNQEAIELARRDREKRSSRVHKWVWGSVVTAITLGSAALAWSYIPSGEGSSSSLSPHTSEPNTTTE